MDAAVALAASQRAEKTLTLINLRQSRADAGIINRGAGPSSRAYELGARCVTLRPGQSP